MNENELIENIAGLNEDRVLLLVKQRLDAGDDPLHILHDCQKGMRLVGELYDEGRYYISGLIMAGEILHQVMELLNPVIKGSRSASNTSGVILLGTVKEDIHDLGKNIVNMLLTCHGFTVHDLGVDVPPDQFVEEAARLRPNIVGLSGLLTVSYNSMKTTIELLREETRGWEKPPFVIIGGSQIDRQVSQLVGTDYWVNEASVGVQLCKRLLSGDDARNMD